MRIAFVLLLCVAAEAQTAREIKSQRLADRMIVQMGEDFTVNIQEVRSLSGKEKVAFSKAPTLYHVLAVSDKAEFLVYCTNAAPSRGKNYQAHVDYLDGSLSFLRLWPEEKKNLNLPPGQSIKGRAYRMLVFRDVRADDRMPPDIACDVKTETTRAR